MSKYEERPRRKNEMFHLRYFILQDREAFQEAAKKLARAEERYRKIGERLREWRRQARELKMDEPPYCH